MDEPWRLPAEVMCRVQREKTWYSGQRGCILLPCQGQNGNPGLIVRLMFVHLSDIHFTKFSGDHYDLDGELREALEHDAVDLTKKLNRPTTGVLVTGDIAFSGKAEEYRMARDWLERLCGLLDVPKANVWLTPGNHDVDRRVVGQSQSLKGLHEKIRDADERSVAQVLQTFYRNGVDALCLFSPFAAYNDFAELFGCDIGPTRPVWKTEEESVSALFERSCSLRNFALLLSYRCRASSRAF